MSRPLDEPARTTPLPAPGELVRATGDNVFRRFTKAVRPAPPQDQMGPMPA